MVCRRILNEALVLRIGGEVVGWSLGREISKIGENIGTGLEVIACG